jgi:hypothetical protein
MLIKILALGPKTYVENAMNLFDGFITVLALVDLGTINYSQF